MMDAAVEAARRSREMRQRLEQAMNVQSAEIIDESHLHVGHAGARDGRGHFRLVVCSQDFAGLSQIQRHRLVYQAIGNLMQTDIHALTIVAYTPTESCSGAAS